MALGSAVGINEPYTIKSGRAEGCAVKPLPHFFNEINSDLDRDAVATACGVINNIWSTERIDQFRAHMSVQLMEISGVTADRKHLIVRFYSDSNVNKALLDNFEQELSKMRSNFYQVEICSSRATRTLGSGGRWMSGVEVLIPRSAYQQEYAAMQENEARRLEEEKHRRLRDNIINEEGALFAPLDKIVAQFSASSSSTPPSAVSRFSNIDADRTRERMHAHSLRQPTKLKKQKPPSMFSSPNASFSEKRSIISKFIDKLFFINADEVSPKE